MSLVPRILLPALILALLPAAAAAQSPTLPSDTLEANYAPRSEPGPAPELAPSLPSDTLEAGAPMVLPDSASNEMGRDWDQDETGGELWEENDEYDVPRLRLGSARSSGERGESASRS